MTVAARKVLADCEIALDMLEREKDFEHWRVHWMGALALLRAVGHVLVKVDGEDNKLRVLIDALYDCWKMERTNNAIFWNFIEEERNNILKEYKFNLYPNENIDIVVQTTAQHFKTSELSPSPQVFQIGENIYRPIADGFNEGEDARDIYREALDWWNTQLTELEKQLTGLGTPEGI